ncbi:M20/M25/M40 family metallo-hydrolase [Streptomyces sp. ISL-99]|uniref:M20/M25/M40 family metallo-hydrolase n=1 Tax=Streptomyces sp. ISL-99 TaxID=2819193 RepID=UPI001BE85865|nr:M20/M25/M40 family metallo-hydrolase [Streptomyces sp. ISL-99]MBT2525912.1 M20/M25/M40 family metallo-hydrolase [Streptomyces sp. ISL-99]
MITGEDEVARLCSELIRIDTYNHGDGRGAGERLAAEQVATWLTEVGLDPVYVESARRRGNVVVRLPGTDPSLPGLLIHGHLDTVPAIAGSWTVPPLSGEIIDDCVWGRGAVDMKNMDAMMLAVLRDLVRSGRRPRRDLVFAWLADEEAGGEFGARHLVEHRPDLFEGVTEAISEVGGFSVQVDAGVRLYFIETAQKGLLWLRLTAENRAGHASLIHPDNAVTELCAAVVRVGRHPWPFRLTPASRALLRELCDAYGLAYDEEDPGPALAALGPLARLVGASLTHISNPTRLHAGYATNVIPETATAEVDGRFLPGAEKDFLDTLGELLGPGVRHEVIDRDPGIEAPFDAPLVDSMLTALQKEDPGARIAPYCLPAGTDNKAFHRLGVRGYGFVPLRLPPELDFASMFHGVDERVPVDALRFGVRVLDRLLTTY